MAVDLNKLSLQTLKAELTQKGLVATGKKSDLVARLKEALESSADAEEEAEVMEEEEEDAEVEGEEKSKEQQKPTGPKRWFHVLTPKKMGAKYKYLDVIQKMSQKRKKKEIQTSLVDHRLRVFPLLTEDLQSPTITDIMKKCSCSTFNFITVLNEEGDRVLKGLLQLTFLKKADIADSVEILKEYREGLHFHYDASEQSFNDFQDDWTFEHTGTRESQENTLMIAPHLPKDMTEDELWDLFPKAREIYICPPKKATIVDVRGSVVEQDQPAYAYVQFPNLNLSKENIQDLVTVTPTEEMKILCFLPFSKLLEFCAAKEEIKTHEKEIEKHKKETTQAKSSPKPEASATINKPKKTLGYVSTPKGVQDRRSNYENRTRQNRPAFVPRSAGFSGPRGMMGQQGPRPQFNNMMNQLQSEAARRGPEEAQGVRVLSNIMSSMGPDVSPMDALSHILEERGPHWNSQADRGWDSGEGAHMRQNFNQGRRSPKRALSPVGFTHQGDKKMRSDGFQTFGNSSDNFDQGRNYGNQTGILGNQAGKFGNNTGNIDNFAGNFGNKSDKYGEQTGSLGSQTGSLSASLRVQSSDFGSQNTNTLGNETATFTSQGGNYGSRLGGSFGSLRRSFDDSGYLGAQRDDRFVRSSFGLDSQMTGRLGNYQRFNEDLEYGGNGYSNSGGYAGGRY